MMFLCVYFFLSSSKVSKYLRFFQVSIALQNYKLIAERKNMNSNNKSTIIVEREYFY